MSDTNREIQELLIDYAGALHDYEYPESAIADALANLPIVN